MNEEVALDSLEKLLSGSLYSCDVEQCNEDYDKVKDYINNLEQQLQAYKAKEKELREYYKEHNLLDEDSYSCEEVFAYYQFKDILDILDSKE